jgi:chaperonin cofactor prefoldin
MERYSNKRPLQFYLLTTEISIISNSFANLVVLFLKIENLKRTITHASLTENEIVGLPDETRVYESVGRMFILSTKSVQYY